MKLTIVQTIVVAALLALQTATAAELPSRQAQPAAAPAAKKCRIDGQEGVMLPGAGTCLRVSGSVSAEAAFGTLGRSSKSGAP